MRAARRRASETSAIAPAPARSRWRGNSFLRELDGEQHGSGIDRDDRCIYRVVVDQLFNSSRSLNSSSASGLASASTFLTGSPCTTLRTASSTILPLLVRGLSLTCTILAGTWRGVVLARTCCLILSISA